MIGIFDSGSGGLTVVKEIRAMAPSVDILYIGDVKNVPYGDKLVEFIQQQTIKMIRLLREHDVTMIVSACNSISATVLHPMFEVLSVQPSDILEMVDPAVRGLVRRDVKEVTLFATSATIRSELYAREATRAGIVMQNIAIPGLAERIEQKSSEQEIDELVTDAVRQVTAKYVLLGCTHYPLITEVFTQCASEQGKEVEFLNPAHDVATEALDKHGKEGRGTCQALISQDSEPFRSRLLEIQPNAEIQIIEI